MVRFSLTAVLVAAGMMIAGGNAAVHAGAVVGQPAPVLVVPELNGETFDLSALRGKVVVLNVWATWCPPCRKEMPVLDSFYGEYHGRGVEMIGLSADRGRDRNQVRKVMQAVHYPAAMLADSKKNGFGTFNVLPVTFVIDSSGVVRARLNPDTTISSIKVLSELVDPLLPPAPAHPAAP